MKLIHLRGLLKAAFHAGLLKCVCFNCYVKIADSVRMYKTSVNIFDTIKKNKKRKNMPFISKFGLEFKDHVL